MLGNLGYIGGMRNVCLFVFMDHGRWDKYVYGTYLHFSLEDYEHISGSTFVLIQ